MDKTGASRKRHVRAVDFCYFFCSSSLYFRAVAF